MPNVVETIRNRIQQEHPGATIVERGERHIKHALGGGKFALDVCVGPLHYHDGTAYQEINTDWIDSDDGAFVDRVSAAPFGVYSDGSGKRRIYPRRNVTTEYVELARPQYWTGSQWRDLNVGARTRSGDSLTWDRPNFTIGVTHTGGQVKIAVTLKSAAAANRIRWPITLVGLSRSGWNLIADSDSVVVASIPQPWLVDANGTERTVQTEVIGSAVELTADVSGLVYPVTIDPTLDLQVGSSGDDGARYSGSTGFSATEAFPYVGYMNNAAYYVSNTYDRFTGLTGLSGVTVTVSYISRRSHGAGVGTPLTKIYAVDAASPAAPTTAAEFDGLTLTTAAVDWDFRPPSVLTWYDGPSINAVIQELCDSYDPSTIVIVHKDDGSASGANNYQRWQSYDNGALTATKLHIEYSAGGADVNASATDTATISEAIDLNLEGHIFTVAPSDTATVSETVVAQVSDLAVGVSDAVTVADSVSALVHYGKAPHEVAGLKVWYKADALALNDNDAVTTWTDSSGNGIDVSQSTADQKPTYKTNIRNGKPAILWDGTNDNLTRASTVGTALIGTNQGEVFAVVMQDGTQAQNTIVAWDSATPEGSNRLVQHYTYENTLYYDHGDSASTGRISGPQPAGWDDTWHIVESYRETGGAGVIKVDNATALSSSFTDTLDNTQSATLGIGCYAKDANTSTWFKGYIAEVFVFDVALSAADRADIITYLSGKYAITVNPITVVDAVAVSETVALTLTTNPVLSVSDSVTVSESVSATVSALNVSVSDSVAVSDTATKLTIYRFYRETQGDGTGTVITLKNAAPVKNFTRPLGLIRYKSNPILTGSGPYNADGNQNVYASEVVYNPFDGRWEMYYAGFDRQYQVANNDRIYLATTTDLLAWTKQNIVLNHNPANDFEDTHVNDPSIVDVPDWNLRVMVYTSAGYTGAQYNDYLCIATAPMGSTTFTKYGSNPVMSPPAAGYVARPTAIYENGKLIVWYDRDTDYIGLGDERYCEITYNRDTGVFTVTDYASNPVITGISQAADVETWGGEYYMVLQSEAMYSGSDYATWTLLSDDYRGNAGTTPAYEDEGQVTPHWFKDLSSIVKGLYYGSADVPTWDENDVSLMMLTKFLRLANSVGTIVKEDNLAAAFGTVELTVSGLTFPYNGQVKVYDEEGDLVTTLVVADVTLGDIYVIEYSDAIPVGASDGVLVAETVVVSIVSVDVQAAVSEAITVSETVTASIGALSIAVSDTVTLTETVTATPLQLLASATETVTVTDTPAADPLALNATAAETVTVSETVTLTPLSVAASVSDSVSVTESVTTDLSVAVSVQDAVTVGETVTASVSDLPASASDSIALTETVVVTLVEAGSVSLSVTDSVTVSETVTAVTPELPASTSDTVTIVETVIARVDVNPAVSDVVAITETISAVASDLLTSVADSATITETVTGTVDINPAVSEMITVTEAVDALVSDLLMAPSETVTVTEAITAMVDLNPAISDVVTVTDVASALVGDLPVSASDTVTVTETTSVSLPEAGAVAIAVSDSVTVTEVVSAVASDLLPIVSETVTITETVAALVDLNPAVSETVTATETVAALASDLLVSPSESVTVSETVSVSIAAGVSDLAINASETVTVSEAIAASVSDVLAAVSDAVTVTETISVDLGALAVNVSESITVSETVGSVAADLRASTNETITLSETVELQVNLDAVASDTIGVSETLAATIPLNPTVSDTVTIVELVSGLVSAGIISVSEAITVAEAINVSMTATATLTLADAVATVLTLTDASAAPHTISDAGASVLTLSDARG